MHRECTSIPDLYGDWAYLRLLFMHLARGAGGNVAFSAVTIYTRFDFVRGLRL